MPELSIGQYYRVTIVTPSYNSVAYLEETIRSVLLQGYPDLEYIIIDGGSTDGSIEIIKKYESWLAIWISEPDNGYAEALNKGYSRGTGMILAWLPASDLYAPNALLNANRYFGSVKIDFLFGRPCRIDEGGHILGLTTVVSKTLRHISLYGRSNPCQPATFWRSEIHNQVGQLNESLRYAADSEWFLRLSMIARSKWIPETVCFIRQHTGQLSGDLELMRNEWFLAWDAVVRRHRLSRLRILIGAIFVVSMMRYRSNGLKSLLRMPDKQSMLSTFLKKSSGKISLK